MEPVPNATVFIVDDDASVREALAWLLRSRRLPSESFESAEAFDAMLQSRPAHAVLREAEKLVLLSLREEGVGTAEIDLIHALRHHPGCTQAALAELLHADKAAIARRTKNLEAKGYLVRRYAPIDRRSTRSSTAQMKTAPSSRPGTTAGSSPLSRPQSALLR